jgi:RNA polymerase sigma-70 factor (ECF subfamily)
MPATPLTPLLRYVGHLTGVADTGADSDAGLLERFAGRRDQAAFALLVERHGPMVLGVLRRLLRHEQDAEDAFQATFLVLARRAGSISKRHSVGSFLHGVAVRVALKARTAAARRRVHERQAALMVAPAAGDEAAWHELRSVLDEELRRLPERYRAPFVLCCLEGRTKPEAARQLGWKEGTVSGRLARARERLRGRLLRCGLMLSAAAVGVLTGERALATVPVALTAAAERAGLPGATAGVVSARAADLADGVIGALTMAKARLATGVTLVFALLTAGLGVLACQALPPASAPAASPDPGPAPAGEGAGPRADEPRHPVPEGALARLGSLRFRTYRSSNPVAFLRDGGRLVTDLAVWDVATGQPLRTL